MKFLADENFPIDSVTLLRKAGFDVDSIQESAPGLKDAEVLSRSIISVRILMTFDRDFGDLIFNQRFDPPPGIVYFRFDPLTSEEPGQLFLDLISGIKIEGRITVISRTSIRQRELPGNPTTL